MPQYLILLLLLLLLQTLAEHSGRLPERLALGCGTREYSATREHERYDVDQMLLNVSVLAVLSGLMACLQHIACTQPMTRCC
jgi:hypothetical protein